MHNRNLTLLIYLALFLRLASSFCPPPPPIIQTNFTVGTRVLTELPTEDGRPAAIICIKPFAASRDLAVVTLTRIYRVHQNGSFSLFLNVQDAFRQHPGRPLNIMSRAHGGVRSIAFHPRFRFNGLIYISAMEDRPRNPRNFRYISDNSRISADSVLVEYKVRGGRPDPMSYRLLFRVGMPVLDHPIKQIEFFGNFLYIAHGDGSVQSAIAGGGQNNNALGKILRINPVRNGSRPYTIPKGNMFPNRNVRLPRETFAYGFRNPHHICFTRGGTLIVADAGRDNYEEVNIVRNGRNYGWSEREGTCVHVKRRSGLQRGVAPLPADDARFNYEYPAAQYFHGHVAGVDTSPGTFVGIAIAGGCPVQNRSPMSGRYWYADFPTTGNLYFSELSSMLRARTRGPPGALTQARTKQVRIRFNGRVYENLRQVVLSDPRFSSNTRVDCRFGRGNRGELYWSSKRDGKIYLFTSSTRR